MACLGMGEQDSLQDKDILDYSETDMNTRLNVGICFEGLKNFIRK